MNNLNFEKFSQEELCVIMGGTNDKHVVRETQETIRNADGSITTITLTIYSDGTFKREVVNSTPTSSTGTTKPPTGNP